MTEKKVALAGHMEDAGNAEKNKTGSWRTFKPRVNEKCIGCGICEFYCPDSAIKVQEKDGKRIAIIDYEHCKGCMICMQVCPQKAIEKGREK